MIFFSALVLCLSIDLRKKAFIDGYHHIAGYQPNQIKINSYKKLFRFKKFGRNNTGSIILKIINNKFINNTKTYVEGFNSIIYICKTEMIHIVDNNYDGVKYININESFLEIMESRFISDI